MEYYLEPRNDSRKSFYKKARVKVTDNGSLIEKVLISYETEVAYLYHNKANNEAFIKDTYSATRLRHIKEFLLQNGFRADSKKQIEKDYIK